MQLRRVGDLLLTLPALAALRAGLPAARVTAIIVDDCAEVAPLLGMADEVLIYRRAGGNGAFWRRLVLGGFDLCLDFTGNDRSALFALLSKARRRVAYRSVCRSRWRALMYNRLVDSAVREHHTVQHHINLLAGAGLSAAGGEFTLALPAWAEEKAAQLRATTGIGPDYLVVHPGSARPEKLWLPERWAEVAGRCRERWGWQVVVTGGPAPAERAAVAAVARLVEGAVDLAGRMDLATLGALLRGARMVATVDSAPMHLAAALGRPQVALFGPTNPFHWRPLHPRAAVVVAGDAGPATEFAPRRPGVPMGELSTAAVLRAMETVLAPTGGGAVR